MKFFYCVVNRLAEREHVPALSICFCGFITGYCFFITQSFYDVNNEPNTMHHLLY